MSLLRTISLFGKTAGQSVEAYPCNMVDFDGNLTTGAAGLYLQFHNKASAPVNTDVPIKSFYIAAAGPTNLASIFQLIGPITFSIGLAIGISSTDATYTAAAATFDFFIDIEENFAAVEAVSGLSTISAGSDAVLTLWSAGSPKRIFSVTIANFEGVLVYPMIVFGPFANGLLPVLQFPSMADGTTKTFYFGIDGLNLLFGGSPGSSSSNAGKDCNLALSTTTGLLTLSNTLNSTLTAKLKT